MLFHRSPAGPATQALGMRQARSAREGPISSFYDSGSKQQHHSFYDDCELFLFKF